MVDSMTSPTAIQANSPRRGRTAPTPQEQLFESTFPMRCAVVRRSGRWTPDADAAAAAGVWEAITAGKTSRNDLIRAAGREVMRLRRHEERQRRQFSLILSRDRWDQVDQYERVDERTDAERFVRQAGKALPMPSEQAWVWIDRMAGTSARAMSPNERSSGTRWVARARAALETFDDVA